MLLKEKVRNLLKEDDKISSVEEGEYITVDKKLGSNKRVHKILNIKPEFTAYEVSGGIDYVFLVKNVFDSFNQGFCSSF